MVRCLTDDRLIEATIAAAGLSRRWAAICGHGNHRKAARLRWRDGKELFLAIRHRSTDGTTATELLSVENTRSGNDAISAAADALEVEFKCQAGFERLLEALRE